jgi:hypothetical protein
VVPVDQSGLAAGRASLACPAAPNYGTASGSTSTS